MSVVELVLQNDGSRTWTADGSVAAAYHWLGREGGGVRPKGQGVFWEGRRTPFPTAVSSGETVALEVVVEAPERPGLWRLQWDLVEEGVCWFSDRAPEAPPALRVLVIPDPWASGFWWSLLVLCASCRCGVDLAVWRARGLWSFSFRSETSCGAWARCRSNRPSCLPSPVPAPLLHGWMLIVAGASVLALLTRVLAGNDSGDGRVGGSWQAPLSLLWADSIYLRFFGDLPAAAAIAGAGQLNQVEASIGDLLTAGDAWLWLDLLPGVVLILVADRLRRSSGPRQSRAESLSVFLR